MIFKSIINVLNTISVTSVVLTFSGTHATLLICAVSNTLSAVGTAILTVVGMEEKYHSHKTSYLQFSDLHNTYMAKLLKDDVSGHELDDILADMCSKVSIILDSCEPVKIPSRDGGNVVPVLATV